MSKENSNEEQLNKLSEGYVGFKNKIIINISRVEKVKNDVIKNRIIDTMSPFDRYASSDLSAVPEDLGASDVDLMYLCVFMIEKGISPTDMLNKYTASINAIDAQYLVSQAAIVKSGKFIDDVLSNTKVQQAKWDRVSICSSIISKLSVTPTETMYRRAPKVKNTSTLRSLLKADFSNVLTSKSIMEAAKLAINLNSHRLIEVVMQHQNAPKEEELVDLILSAEQKHESNVVKIMIAKLDPQHLGAALIVAADNMDEAMIQQVMRHKDHKLIAPQDIEFAKTAIVGHEWLDIDGLVDEVKPSRDINEGFDLSMGENSPDKNKELKSRLSAILKAFAEQRKTNSELTIGDHDNATDSKNTV
jgi:hypothetical protein